MFNLITAVILILFAAFSRLLPHPMNFAPVTAIALFAGVYLNKRYAIIVPIAALIISDAFIGFYSYIYWIYGTMIIIALVGMWLRGRVENGSAGKKVAYIFGTTLASSIIFFIITNFGVWTSGMFYEMSFKGLIDCYIAAIPFFRNALAGDLVYVTAMFGIYELVLRFTNLNELEQNKIRK
jgi:asparagine N-glycosylation enzyme membrane subunit Stt3